MSNAMFFSRYEKRIAQTPSEESNRWEGQRGESCCLPGNDRSKAILDAKGIKGIEYENGVPDFSPVSESTVKIGNMNAAQRDRNRDLVDGYDAKGKTIYAHRDEDGQLYNGSPYADKNSTSDLNMKYYNPSNYTQADILTAEQWSKDGRDGKKWTAEDVAQYRKDNNLTWHECNDCETMMLVPSEINSDFGHLGGVSEIKRRNEIIREADMECEALQFEDDEIDEALQKARDEAGYEAMNDEEKEEFDETFHLMQEREKYESEENQEKVEDFDHDRGRQERNNSFVYKPHRQIRGKK